MKVLIPIILIGLQIFSSNALAVFAPGWERPISRADQFTIISAEGELEEVSQIVVTMHKEDGPEQLKSLSILINGQIVKLKLLEVAESACGSTHYVAREESDSDTYLQIELIDNSTRKCKDLRPYIWEINLKLYNLNGEAIGHMELGGNPEPVYTILGASEFQFQVEQDQFRKASFNN